MTTEAVTARAKLLRQELTRFIEIVTQQMQPERILLFGSFAAGQVSEWSDLELVVITQAELPFYEWIKHLLCRVRPRVGMDVLVYTPAEWAEMISQRSCTQQDVLNKGQVVYARGG